jgi:hypothetical protein
VSYQPSVLEQLQLDMGGRIQAHPSFANVPVKIIRPRDQASALLIQTEIDQALEGITLINGVGGVTVLVNMPSADVPNPEIPGPRMAVILTARVIENPLVNMGTQGTGVSAEDYALEILNLFSPWYNQDLGGSVVPAKQAMDPVADFIAQGKIAYDLRFTVPMGLIGPPKVARPVINGTTSTGALIAAAAGLEVYYTLDGSYPAPQNSAAVLLGAALLDDEGHPIVTDNGLQLYSNTGNIPLTSGMRVRAVAYSTSTTQASDLASLLVP